MAARALEHTALHMLLAGDGHENHVEMWWRMALSGLKAFQDALVLHAITCCSVQGAAPMHSQCCPSHAAQPCILRTRQGCAHAAAPPVTTLHNGVAVGVHASKQLFVLQALCL